MKCAAAPGRITTFSAGRWEKLTGDQALNLDVGQELFVHMEAGGIAFRAFLLLTRVEPTIA
jgi:hypothetical protein